MDRHPSLTRRAALQSLACATCLLPLNSNQAAQFSDVNGCVVPASAFGSLASHVTRFASPNTLITTTGNPAYDRAFGRALVRISQIFNERPGFGFIDDSGAPNAYASSETKVPGTWGTVMFGQTMFQSVMDRSNDQGIAVMAIVAHEFGHIAQFRSGLMDHLLTGQSTVKRIELHADLLAGYFLGLRKQENPEISLWFAGRLLYEIGDFEFNNRNHHGTPDERVAMAETGFEYAMNGLNYDQAFQRGSEQVLSNF